MLEVTGASDLTVAAWQFFGPSRVAEVVLGNGIIQTMMNNARTRCAFQPCPPSCRCARPRSDRRQAARCGW
jgi:hypothetical protein